MTYSDNGSSVLAGTIIPVVGLLIAVLPRCMGSCDVPEDHVRELVVLTTPGVEPEDITVGGHSWWGCGDGDAYTSEFTLRTDDGRVRNGVVCCGYSQLKNCTVRWR